MSKMNLSVVSLVAALPAGLLAYLLVLVIVNDPGIDKLPGLLKVFVGVSLLAAALLALMPVGIFLFVGRANKSGSGPVAGRRAKAGAAAGAAGAVAADEFATDEEADEELGADEFDEDLESDQIESDEFAEDEFAEDEFAEDEFESSEEGDLFGSDDGFDTFDMDDEGAGKKK